jgi:transcription elongation factor GreA
MHESSHRDPLSSAFPHSCPQTTPPDGSPVPAATMRVVPPTQHLSQAAYDRLVAELEQLTTHGRTDIARKIQAARELGDLKENGDYHSAKDEQGQMEGRIRHLEAMIENAEIVERGGTDHVQHGSVIAIRYEGDDDTERYLIGHIEEKTGDIEVISPGSPLGESLLGAKPGDIVEYQAPGGALKVEVVEIEG